MFLQGLYGFQMFMWKRPSGLVVRNVCIVIGRLFSVFKFVGVLYRFEVVLRLCL